ncbi:MAG: isoamylase early set domain-containing protein [Gemmatimonadales bacterium]
MAENYDDSADAKDAEFAEQIAARLRAPEHVQPSFEKRLMEKVHAEAGLHLPASGSSRRSWWRSERVFRVAPLTGLALAAGISLIIGVAGIAIGSRISALSLVANRAAATAQRDTVQVVRFVFVDTGATRVELVGDFNEWAKGSTELKPSGAPGVWAVSVPLSPGRHEYAFIINGSRWVADPLAVKSSDDFGTESSVIRVGTPANSTT